MVDDAPDGGSQPRVRVAPTVTVPPDHAQSTFHGAATPKPPPTTLPPPTAPPTLRGVSRTGSDSESLSPPVEPTLTAGEDPETLVRLGPVVILALSMLVLGAVAGYAVGWTRAIAAFEATFGVELVTHP